MLIRGNKFNLRYIGLVLFLGGLVLLFVIYWPLAVSYLDYMLFPVPGNVEVQIIEEGGDITSDISKDTTVVFVDNSFGLYIPKIKANARVIKNIDPYNESEYTEALKQAVAHARGSSLPDGSGNVFLFAHSAVNFYERKDYNVYFYLLGELDYGDNIYVSYNSELFKYTVLESKIVAPEEVSYLGSYMEEDTLTLMTCWPAGVDLKRIVVTAVRDK